MVRAVTAGIIGLLLFAALGGQAEAKGGVSFTITGGDLGEYAATVTAPMPDGPYVPIGIPTNKTVAVSAPESLPELAYDIYYAGFVTAEGPAYRYYPDVRLLHDGDYNRWLELLPEAAALLDDSIEQALISLEGGELERGVARSWLRDTRMDEGSYWLRPYLSTGSGAYQSVAFGSYGGRALVSDAETFVMQHLVEVAGARTVEVSARTPRHVIHYEVFDGQGSFGGPLGLYAPPADGQPGLFWAYVAIAGPRAYETTPGFDAAIGDALARQETAAEPAPEQVEDADSDAWRVPLIGAIAAVGTVTIAAGAVRLRPLAASRR